MYILHVYNLCDTEGPFSQDFVFSILPYPTPGSSPRDSDNPCPDPIDDADMDSDIPDQQSLSYSEMKLYKHAITYKWTVDELMISTIKLIKSTDFKVGDVNIDLHKRVAAATLVIDLL